MARLALADRSHIEAVSRESHSLWGAGLTVEAYRDLWLRVSRCAWGRKYARYYVWLDDDGQVLSSTKLYRPLLRLGRREERCTVLGAVFTPRARRGQGHASAMVRALLGMAARRGEASLLFSDIGTRYYAALGFRPLPAEEQWGRIPPPERGAPQRAMLRPATVADWPNMLAAHAASSRHCPIAVIRDLEHWEFLWLRSTCFFGSLGDAPVRQRWEVATLDGEFLGYHVSVEGHGEWNVREVGAIDGATSTMVRVLRRAAASAWDAGLRSFYGWLPREVVAGLEPWSLRTRARRRAIPMIHLEDGDDVLQRLGVPRDEVYIPFQDQF